MKTYPHCEYHHPNFKWFIDMLKRLKDWCQKLTIAILKMKSSGCEVEIIDELKALIEDLESKIDGMNDEIEELADAAADDVQSLVDGLNDIVSNIINVSSALYETGGGGGETDLTAVWEAINSIASDATSTTLVQGVDYEIHPFGYFQCDDLHVTATETVLNLPTGKQTSIKVRIRSNSDYPLTNTAEVVQDNYYQTPRFRHADNWLDVPRSWMYVIEFKDTDKFNHLVGTDNSTALIWNVGPVGRRASWAVVCGIFPCKWSGSTAEYAPMDDCNSLVVCANSIADGYNSQYDDGYYDYPMTFGLLNTDVSAEFVKYD